MKTIFIGPIGDNNDHTGGALVKNNHIINVIKQHISDLTIIDTAKWKNSIAVLIKLFVTIICNRKAKYIVSASYGSAYKILKILKKLCPQSQIIYWVIGGYVDKLICSGALNPNVYKGLHNIIVEGASMKKTFDSLGIDNVSVMPNFRPRPNYKSNRVNIKSGNPKSIFRFIFLSRILPEKGVNLILDAVKNLNQSGCGVEFVVDFYGTISATYKTEFEGKVSKLQNVSYKGFLDLSNSSNYGKLSEYDIMIFPTYWKTEGCPGVIIDAYLSGVPVIASDWNLNSDYVRDGVTGILIAPKDVKSLENAMIECLQNRQRVENMKTNACVESEKYLVNNVLSIDNLKALSII